VTRDVVEQETLAEASLADHDRLGAGALEDPGKEQTSRHRDVPPAWIQPRDPELLLLRRPAEHLVDLLQAFAGERPMSRRAGLAADDGRFVDQR
jgi:hypothetical protein